ncbi:MAG: IS630 family transposase, partial [Acidovorax sp.]
AWEELRNASGARIHWMFSTDKARDKLAKAYPVPTSSNLS